MAKVRMLSALALAITASLVATSAASGWSYGFNRVQSVAEAPDSAVGYGPGWVGLTYKSNGPIVGYLFASGFRFADGSSKTAYDHLNIFGTRDYAGEHPTISRWPWGYAYGHFEGCAYGYGTQRFAIVDRANHTTSCSGGPTVNGSWWHNETVFCTNYTADKLCSPEGVWSEGKPAWNTQGARDAHTLAGGCAAYGNVGAANAYGSGPPRWADRIGTIPANQNIDVRYVTKDRTAAVVKWRAGNLISGIEWGFVPRSCIAPGFVSPAT